MADVGADINKKLREWIDANIPSFLLSLNDKLEDPEEGADWEIPMVDDYALIFSVNDLADGYGGVFMVHDAKVPHYRLQGLIQAAL